MRKSLVLIAVLLAGLPARAVETVGVPGSNARYATAVEYSVDGKPVQFALTGAGLRKRGAFSVYSIGSYVQEGTTVKSAEDILSADAPKLLIMIMERNISGRDMAEAIHTGIQLNHPAGTFAGEMKKIGQQLAAIDLRKGDHVMLTWVPKVGLRCQIGKRADLVVDSPAFAHAVWEIFFARRNINEQLKIGLVSRLSHR